jgi:hypothetical protein
MRSRRSAVTKPHSRNHGAKAGLDRPGDVMPTLEMIERRRRARAVGLELSASIEEIERAERGVKTIDLTRVLIDSLKSQPTISRVETETSPIHTSGIREKDVEHAGDQLMQTYGFRVIRFSQPRASKQTPGIPDRLYMHAQRQLVVWWEAKGPRGKQRPAQERFQALAIATGMEYVLGGVHELRAWLTRKLEVSHA